MAVAQIAVPQDIEFRRVVEVAQMGQLVCDDAAACLRVGKHQHIAKRYTSAAGAAAQPSPAAPHGNMTSRNRNTEAHGFGMCVRQKQSLGHMPRHCLYKAADGLLHGIALYI